MNAMILAAGLGTRLRPYSEYRPKPLFPILGEPLILHLIGQLREQGFGAIAINTHFLSEQFGEILDGVDDITLHFEENILGTGGSLRRAGSLMGPEPFLVVNGDILHSLDLAGIYRQHLASGAMISMVVHDQARFNNIRVSANGSVTALRVCKDDMTPGSEDRFLAFAGIHVVDPVVIKDVPDAGFYDIIDIYRKFIGTGGRINSLEFNGHFWTDIGTARDYLDLHKLLLTSPGLANELGFDGPSLKPVTVASDALLGADVCLEEWAFVGARARIGKGVRIARSVVWDGAVVADGAVIEDEIVGR